MTQRPKALPVELAGIPADLKAIDRWVLWRFVERSRPDGSKVWAKLPMSVTGRAASASNPADWASYDAVCDEFIMGDGYDGIGLVLADGLHGIDLDDCRDPMTEELTPLAQQVLARVDGYAEVSPSGTGLKVFTRTNLAGSRTKKAAGVECYVNGRYFTVTGQKLKGAGLPAQAQDLGWFVREVWDEDLATGAEASEDALLNYKEAVEGWDLERVIAEILPHLDPDCGYDEWLRVGAALHHQSGGDPEWLQAWDEWSAASGKYVEGYCEQKWDSFSQQRAQGAGAVTLRSLIKQTSGSRKEAEREERVEVFAELRQVVAECQDSSELQERVADRVARARDLLDIEREQLAVAIQKRAKELDGISMPIAAIRKWVSPRSVGAAVDEAMPEWAKAWVYVTEGDKFFSLETKAEVTAQGFRAKFNRFMPMKDDGSRERADVAATDLWNMPVVAHKAYMPSCGPVFQMFGLDWANLYRPESVPEVPDEIDAAGQEAINLVQQHLERFLESTRERQLLLSWVAHNVQCPGVKIRWAPYIHGAPGDGKSFWLELLGIAMGGQNVRSLNGSTLESNFTDWAVGYAICGIEEMKQHGHNRHEVMNRLKPMITNTVIEVHPKGRPSYVAPNVSNYIIFSNYLDGAPVDEGDRRYMFLSSRLQLSDIEAMTRDGYFARLFEAVKANPGAVRKWLLGVSLHSEFDPNGRAPDTDIKHTVVQMSKSDFDLAVEDLLDAGAPGVSRLALSSGHFTAALRAAGVEAPSSRALHSLLTRLGYRSAFSGQPRKWNGKSCRVWKLASADLKDSLVFAELDKSMAADFL